MAGANGGQTHEAPRGWAEKAQARAAFKAPRAQEGFLMSTSAVASASGKYTTPAFWEHLWRSAGLQFAGLFIVTYIIYGYQPGIVATPVELAGFYTGERTRVLVAAFFAGLNLLNLLWFTAALRATLADAGQDGWGTAATTASAAFGALFFLYIAVGSALAYAIANPAHYAITSALNDLMWADLVLTSFPRAMLTMAAAFGLWRARLISNTLFAIGVAAVVLTLLGGTTWMSTGFWAADGAYTRFVSPAIGLAWLLVVSRVLLTQTPATRAGW